jgi:hypothetical protein
MLKNKEQETEKNKIEIETEKNKIEKEKNIDNMEKINTNYKKQSSIMAFVKKDKVKTKI